MTYEEQVLRDRIEALERDQERLEWLGTYLWAITGTLWPQNETTKEMEQRLFCQENWRNAIDDAMRESE